MIKTGWYQLANRSSLANKLAWLACCALLSLRVAEPQGVVP